jgi:HK97 family phage major capsid protein
MTNENTELTKSVETALVAFNEYKEMVEGFDKKLKDITPKLDAFDQSKLDKLAKDICDGIEASQKAAASAKAAEENQKSLQESHKLLEAELTGIKTALNRAPAGTAEDKSKESSAQVKKLFNQFARSKRSQQEDFSEFLEKSGDDPEVKALSVGSDPDGGYLVMPEFGGIIQTKVFESSPIRQLASVISISSDTYEYVLDNGEADGEWVGETVAPTTETTPTVGKKSITVHEIAAKPKATQKLLDDGIIDVEPWLAGKVADIFARKEATAFVSGNGVAKPRGILTYTAGTDIGQEQIEQVVTGSAANFTYDGMVDLQNSLKEDYQSNASFLFKRATNAALMKIKDGEGTPIFNLTYDKNVGLRPTLMGQPVYFGNDMPSLAANALAMVYGDIRRAYQIVDRVGIRVLRDPYTSKPYIIFYTTKRVGGAVINFEAVKIAKVAAA